MNKDKFNKDADVAFRRAKLGLIGIGVSRVQSAQAAFFGHLAFKLKDLQCTHIAMRAEGGTLIQPIETAATDGRYIWYNPDFFLGKHPGCPLADDAERVFVMCHEIMHCALQHMHRLKDSNRDKAQIAFDLAINGVLKDAGFKCPAWVIMPGVAPYAKYPPNLTAEQYYAMLPDPKPSQCGGKGKDGKGESYGDGCGAVFIPDQVGEQPGEGESKERGFDGSEADWKMAVAEAAQLAKQRGTIPGGLQAMIDDLLQTPKVDWRTILAQFLTTLCRDDFTWTKLSRRSSPGICLPSLHSDRIGHVMVAIDTSGSVSDESLRDFCAELHGIMSCLPARVSVIWHDCIVHRVDEWEPSDGQFKARPVGRGGTSHVPVFARVDEEEEPPICLVCLTDLYSEFPEKHPDYPTLWVTVGSEEAPFGDVVKL